MRPLAKATAWGFVLAMLLLKVYNHDPKALALQKLLDFTDFLIDVARVRASLHAGAHFSTRAAEVGRDLRLEV
jgi:hypothetical protein